ncbi:MAG TPA: hypothetical protein VF498_05245, partial [Anaerolineales bacterium]
PISGGRKPSFPGFAAPFLIRVSISNCVAHIVRPTFASLSELMSEDQPFFLTKPGLGCRLNPLLPQEKKGARNGVLVFLSDWHGG